MKLKSTESRRSRSLLGPLSVCTAAWIAPLSPAAIIPYVETHLNPNGAKDAWFALTGSERRSLDFEETTGWVDLATHYVASHGVAFGHGNPVMAPRISNSIYPDSPPTMDRLMGWYDPANEDPHYRGLIVDFTPPQRAFALNRFFWPITWDASGHPFLAPLSIRLSRGSDVIGQLDLGSDMQLSPEVWWTTFVGLTSDQPFDRMRIWATTPTNPSPYDDGTVDDVHWAAGPAPGVLGVLALAGFRSSRHRRRR